MVIYINPAPWLKFDRLDSFKYFFTRSHWLSPNVTSDTLSSLLPQNFPGLAAEQDEKQGMEGAKHVLVTVSAGTVHCYHTGLLM